MPRILLPFCLSPLKTSFWIRVLLSVSGSDIFLCPDRDKIRIKLLIPVPYMRKMGEKFVVKILYLIFKDWYKSLLVLLQ